MLISVIIPVYNVKDYLEKCVSSVLSCDTSDCEVILVDDGSTDGESGKLCDKIAQENATVVRVIHQKNKGLGGARNTGIEVATGEYLFFLDSDDTVSGNTLEILKKVINKTHADIISFNMKTDDGNGNGEFIRANYIEKEEPFTLKEEPLYLLSLASACSRVWKRKLYLDYKIQFPERVWYEDIRTTTKLFAVAKSIVTIKDSLYLYFQRPGSIMRSDNVDRNHEIIEAFEDLVEWYKEQGLFETYKNVLCGLCIENLYLAASVRVLRVNTKHPLLAELSAYIGKEFPDYKNNPCVSQLPRARKIAFYLLEMKQYKLLDWLFRIRNKNN